MTMNSINALTPDNDSAVTGYGRHARIIMWKPSYLEPNDDAAIGYGATMETGRVDFDGWNLPMPGVADVRKFSTTPTGWRIPSGFTLVITPPEAELAPYFGGPTMGSRILLVPVAN